ncbi:MAG: hypothetical protein M1363_04035, partial [Gammaproteobacteria bacterium]|nr:hypothetical protein [Gammaproteobacteria bacterium]
QSIFAVQLGWKQVGRILLVFVGVFLILGGAYFLWRWQYFGYPLPNPYYKKGGGSFYPASLADSINGVLELSFPFWLVYAWGLVCIIQAGLTRFVQQQVWFDNLKKAILQVFNTENHGRLINILKVMGTLFLAAFILGLFRQSSNLHAALVFGRYSPQLAGLLMALLVTGVIAISASGWMPIYDKKTAHQSDVSENGNPAIPETIRNTIYTGIPVTGFVIMWILLSNEMNYLWRFQYPILPVILMSWPLLLAGFWKSLNLPEPNKWPIASHSLVVIAVVILGVGLVWSQANRWKINYQTDGRFEVAQYLSQYQAKAYTVATTEAGLIPLYSGWQAVDTCGLNDQRIAHNGGITSEYLAKIKPEIIMFHADFSPIAPRQEAGDAWESMTLTLDTYARENNYTLAAVYGASPVDTHYYYVRPDFPESQEIVAFIQSLDGGKYKYGAHTIDYNKLTWKKEGNGN